jgi:hypothetical protein
VVEVYKEEIGKCKRMFRFLANSGESTRKDGNKANGSADKSKSLQMMMVEAEMLKMKNKEKANDE